jgi:hypothetical protein
MIWYWNGTLPFCTAVWGLLIQGWDYPTWSFWMFRFRKGDLKLFTLRHWAILSLRYQAHATRAPFYLFEVHSQWFPTSACLVFSGFTSPWLVFAQSGSYNLQVVFSLGILNATPLYGYLRPLSTPSLFVLFAVNFGLVGWWTIQVYLTNVLWGGIHVHM